MFSNWILHTLHLELCCRILMSSYPPPALHVLCTDFRINTHILNMAYKVQQGLALPASPVLCYTILHFQSNRIGLLLISSHIQCAPIFHSLGFFFFFCINVLIPTWLHNSRSRSQFTSNLSQKAYLIFLFRSHSCYMLIFCSSLFTALISVYCL